MVGRDPSKNEAGLANRNELECISWMEPTLNRSSELALAPLGAGDLIDRAVRFYRGNFKTFLFIAAPPVVIGTIVSVGWRMLGRELFYVNARIDQTDLVFY